MVARAALSSADRAIAELAARQHGVVTLLQLLAAGLTRAAIRHRERTGRVIRLSRGVYAVGHAGLPYEGRVLASVLACGEGAAAGRLTAAYLLGASRFGRPALDAVVVPQQRRARAGIRLHASTTLRPADVTTHRGIPITRFARTVVDLEDVLTAHQAANVLHRGAYRGLFGELALRDQLARARRTKVVRRALDLYLSGSAGTRSLAEDAFLRLVTQEPLVNTHLLGEEVDFFWPDRRLVVEIDGPHHGRRTTREDDRRRDAKLTAAGYAVTRFADGDVHSGADWLLRQCPPEQRAQLGPLLGR
jgi:very-short-patch-repair endonuclease